MMSVNNVSPFAGGGNYSIIGRNYTTIAIPVVVDDNCTYIGLARTTSSSDNRLFNPIMIPIDMAKISGGMILIYSENGVTRPMRLTYSDGNTFSLTCDVEDSSYYAVAFEY